MKKLFTFMSIAIVAMFSSISIKAALPLTSTYVPDNYLRNYLYQYLLPSGNIVQDSYGVLYVSDYALSYLTEIEIDAKNNNISSFQGLEYFSSLQHLICKNMLNRAFYTTYINQVDIITLDNCPNLNSSFILGNPRDLQFITLNNCSSIKSIDVSNCPALTDLRVVKCPAVTNINTQDIHTLEMLCISGSPLLTSLNLDNNKELRVLDFYGTGIEDINLNNNIKLLALLPGQKIKSINTSNNTKLKYLDCSGCSLLESLDLSTNKELTTLLYDNCHMASIDLTYNSKLSFYSSSQEASEYNIVFKAKDESIDGCKSLQQWKMRLGYSWDQNRRTVKAQFYKDDSGRYVYFMQYKDLETALGPNIDLSRIDQWMYGVTVETASAGNKIVVFKRSYYAPSYYRDETGTAEYSYKSNFNNNLPTTSYGTVSKTDRRYYPHFYIDWTATPQDLTTAIEGVETNNEATITTSNGSIVVEGYEGSVIEVYSLNGSRIYSGTDNTISVESGMYLVKVGNKTHKVIVK